MRNLAPGWEWATVSDVADVQLGRQRSPQHHYGPNMRPYLRSANVTWAGLALDDVKEMNFNPIEAKAFELQPGDVLLNEASGSPSEVGKPAIWRGEIPGCCFQNTLLRVRTRGPQVGYLYWYFYYVARQGQFGDAGRGVNIRHLGKQGLAQFPVPVAPLEEQKRIVTALEESLSGLDAADDLVSHVPTRLDRLREGLLRHAFDPTWERVPITSVTDPERLIRYGILKPGDNVPDGVPVVKVRDYRQGVIELESLKRTTPEIAAQFEGATLRRGDVLISIRGTYGRVAPVPDELEGANITQDSARIAPLPSVDRGFLVHFLRSPECQEFLRRVARGVAVKGVNIRDLRQLPVPSPTLPIQRKAAARLDDELSVAERASKSISVAQRSTDALRRSVLAAAFAGRLVPQDPTERPASAMLERIRADRATGIPRTRNRAVKAS
jgi:type I restriction enzyme, S subunit